MKRLKIPYCADLNSNELSSIVSILADKGASDMIEQVNWKKQFPYKPLTEFSVLRNDTSLLVRFFVRGNMLKAVYSKDQSPVYQDSCVEFYCKVPTSEYYYNFEFNCIGTCSASRRKSRTEDVQRLNEQEMLSIKRFSSIGRKAFQEMQGMFEWELTIEIPLQLIGVDSANLPTHLMANFYKCADDTVSPHYVSWSPIQTDVPDFHRPEFFAMLEF